MVRAHGLRGEVVVTLVTDSSRASRPAACRRRDRGPLIVVSSRPHQARWLVPLRGCARPHRGRGARRAGAAGRGDRRPGGTVGARADRLGRAGGRRHRAGDGGRRCRPTRPTSCSCSTTARWCRPCSWCAVQDGVHGDRPARWTVRLVQFEQRYAARHRRRVADADVPAVGAPPGRQPGGGTARRRASLEVEAVDVGRPGGITDADAPRAGYPSAAALLADLGGTPRPPSYRVQFHAVAGPDPRDELAADDSLTAARRGRARPAPRAARPGQHRRAVDDERCSTSSPSGRRCGRRAGGVVRAGRRRRSSSTSASSRRSASRSASGRYRLAPRRGLRCHAPRLTVCCRTRGCTLVAPRDDARLRSTG